MRTIDPTLAGAMPGDHFSKRFREARKHCGLSQSKAADRIGISASSISKIERGGVTMVSDPMTLVHAASVFEVSPLWLYAGASAGMRFVPEWYSLEARREGAAA